MAGMLDGAEEVDEDEEEPDRSAAVDPPRAPLTLAERFLHPPPPLPPPSPLPPVPPEPPEPPLPRRPPLPEEVSHPPAPCCARFDASLEV